MLTSDEVAIIKLLLSIVRLLFWTHFLKSKYASHECVNAGLLWPQNPNFVCIDEVMWVWRWYHHHIQWQQCRFLFWIIFSFLFLHFENNEKDKKNWVCLGCVFLYVHIFVSYIALLKFNILHILLNRSISQNNKFKDYEMKYYIFLFFIKF